jgi:hypothetical protein
MSIDSAQRPTDPVDPVAPVTEEDENVQLAAQAEEDRLRRQRGAQSNRLVTPQQRTAGNRLNQTGA